MKDEIRKLLPQDNKISIPFDQAIDQFLAAKPKPKPAKPAKKKRAGKK